MHSPQPVRTAAPWYSDEAGFFSTVFLEEYAEWISPVRTETQVRFVAEILKASGAARVLDLGCGNGRHAIALADEDFRMTGADLSVGMLDRARSADVENGVQWIRCDMRQLPFENRFDAVLSLFTSFGFFESEDDDRQTIEQVAETLAPDGIFVLDVMNPDFVLDAMTEDEIRLGSGGAKHVHRRRYDRATRVLTHKRTTEIAGRQMATWSTAVRMYAHDELVTLLAGCGLRVLSTYSGYGLGQVRSGGPRIILVAEKHS